MSTAFKKTIESIQKKPWLLFIPLALVAVIAGLLFIISGDQANAKTTAYQTTQVKRGDLSVEITGTGALVAGKQVDLGFSTSGAIQEINVKLGETVMKGQVLATLSEIDQLQVALDGWKIKLNTAQETLDNLLNGGDQTLAQALKDYAAAREIYAEAKKNLHEPGDARCAPSKTEEYYYQYLNEQNSVNIWEDYLQYGNTGYGTDYILKNLKTMRENRDKAYTNMTYCQGYSDQEILESQAALQLADAKLKLAEKTYNDLLSNAGIDPQQAEIAQADVDNAEAQVTKARNDLDGATITAPMDGTVVALDAEAGDTIVAINKIQNASAGETVYTSEFITISDLTTTYLDLNIDQSDLQNFSAGCPAEITFNAISGRTFNGTVTEVDPTLTTVSGGSYAHGLIEVKDAQMTPGKSLLLGLSGSATVTCHTAQNVLLVPVSAWYQGSDGSSYVYVLNGSGVPEKRSIAIGLQGTSYVEVTDGLSEGDSVVISQVEPNE